MNKALIIGLTSQGGPYLGEPILDKGNHVHCIWRSISLFTTDPIDHWYEGALESAWIIRKK